MPSERSMPSEMTGEKAARTKARSISLQTWTRPFWMTVSVTGSRLDMAAMTSAGYDQMEPLAVPFDWKRVAVCAKTKRHIPDGICSSTTPGGVRYKRRRIPTHYLNLMDHA